jgi:predicted ATPase
MTRFPFYVITGASGAGKSTLLQALGEKGFSVMREAALAILQEQEQCSGGLHPSTDLQAFMNEVVKRNIDAYDAATSLPPPVFFDRGIPECLGHMRLLGLDVDPAYLAGAAIRRYADTVFVAEPWPDIYARDQWRRAPFERAARSFDATVASYVDAGYTTCVLPRTSVEERVAFILEQVRIKPTPGASYRRQHEDHEHELRGK